MLELGLVFGDEERVVAIFFIGIAQFSERMHQGLGHKNAAVRSKMTASIG